MKGGHRFGAGRPSSRPQTSWAARLDVRRLAEGGRLGCGGSVIWKWSNGLQATIADRGEAIELAYRYPFANGERDIRAWVPIERTPCHLGGSRPWFACPRCHRRVAILYLWGYPACRSCHRMGYPSQSEGTMDRSWRRTQKIEAKLGGEWLTNPKPKWMRWATYKRLCDEACREEEVRDDEMFKFVQRLMPV